MPSGVYDRSARKKQFCPNDHDTFICGRDKTGWCNICKGAYKIQYRKDHRDKMLIYLEKYYEDNKNEMLAGMKEYYDLNSEEIKKKVKEYQNKNKDIIKKRNQEYYIINKKEILEKNKEYIKNHPEVRKLASANNRVKRKSSLVDFGQEGMLEFYNNMPDNMTGDHIIPIVNEKVQGLHVIWNLQYLTGPENSSKGNRIDLIWASEWYEKILEEAGLK